MYLIDSYGFYLKPYQHVKGQPVPANVVTQEPPVARDGLEPRYVGSTWKLTNRQEYIEANEPEFVEGQPTQTEIAQYLLDNRQAFRHETNEQLYGQGNVYYASTDQFIRLEHDVIDTEGNKQEQIDAVQLGYPPVLQLPVSKIVIDGDVETIVDEVYFKTRIIKGKIICTGKIPNSGNWKIRGDRVDKAIAAIKAEWAVTFDTVTFYANDPIPEAGSAN